MKKDTRVKYNLISSLVYQIVLISISFLLPRLYLDNFGSNINGVLSTIKQIFTYLCLLEAGVGLATTQALYKFVGEGDKKSISSILRATHSYYVKTGIVYFLIVIGIAVAYAFFIPTGINSTVVFLMVILNAVPSLFSYFFQAKYRILMEVDGRKYVINNSDTVVQLVANAGKVLVIMFTDSLVLIQFVYCVIALFQLVYLYIYAKRRYEWLDFDVEPDFKSISQKNSVLVHQLSGMVFNNTDVILLSVFCDFRVVSVYTIYNIFFSQMQNFITSIVSGFNFKLGQMFHNDRQRFITIFEMYETFYIMGTFIIYTLMAVFLLPLIQIYTGGINDAEYTNVYLVFLFVIMNLLSNGKLPSNSVLEYSGVFRETRSHAIIEMIINIVVSVFAIIYWGICGAIVGTIAALLYRSVMMIYYSNRKVLSRSMFATYKRWIINGCVFSVIMFIFFVDSFSYISFGRLLIKGIMHAVWIVALYFVVNFIFNKKDFKTVMDLYRGKMQ